MSWLRVRGGLVVTPEGAVERDLIVTDERIEALVDRGVEATAEVELDASGLVVPPGAVDGHIHFVVDDTDLFEPDPSEADEFEEGGRAAAAGGVTTIVEMPQAQPPTTDTQRFVRKRELGEPQAIVDFALWGGVVQGSDTKEIPRTAGGRKRLLLTSRPRRRRLVCAARADSSVQPSKIGPSRSPPIGIRWSNSHACSISETASASRQTRKRST